MSIHDFDGTIPEFLPERYFDGHLDGWGIMLSPLNNLSRRCTIKASGQWNEADQLVDFTEVYTFDDGHKDELRWTIRKKAPGLYSGDESTLVDSATGEQAGCAYHWSYTRNTPQKDGSQTKLDFDDWFYLVDAQTCLVRGTIGRLGLPFATAFVTYVRRLE